MATIQNSADTLLQATPTRVADANLPPSIKVPMSQLIGTIDIASQTTGNLPNTRVSGLGSISTQNASAVSITGGTVSNVTADNISLIGVPTAPTAAALTSTTQVSTTAFSAAADAVVLASAKAYADGLVVGLWDDRGNYDASVNVFPSTGGSGTSGAVLKGDIWMVSVAGTLAGVPVAARQTIRATIDSPAQTANNWAIGLANTDIDDSITDAVTGRAPSQNAVFDALALKADKVSPTFTTPSLGVATATSLASSGNISTTVAGAGLKVKEGTNAKQGVATLVAGTAVVSNTSITASSRVFLTSQSDGGVPGFLRVSTRTAAANFTILSSNALDTSVVAYQIFEPS